MPRVRLENAYFWACPVCQTDNFEKSIRAELTPDERAEMQKSAEQQIVKGAEYIFEGEWVTAPESVQCNKCEAQFDVDTPDFCDDLPE